VNEAACQADGVPILRRASGGGTVLLGPGCLCYTLVLAYAREPALSGIRSSYAYILDRIREGLVHVLPHAVLAGISDLASDGSKFSGNAQQRKQRYLLHHGTLLYAFDASQVGRYLSMPVRQPDYRQQRDHALFLMNLPLDAGELKRQLCHVWRAATDEDAWPETTVAELVANKYDTSAWVRRR
jgi:lipoate-protein ligase A